MDVELFNFDLPDERIALRPAIPRDSARMLHVRGDEIADHVVQDLPNLLRAGDILVLNETRVLRASLTGKRPARAHGGGGDVSVQINLHKCISKSEWRAFARPAKRLKDGDFIHFSHEVYAEVFEKREGGDVGLRFNLSDESLVTAIEHLGEMPLPPYIARQRGVDDRDNEDYQTIFATESGSVAAPTAGLHFTPALFDALKKIGVKVARITLHVGAGTFLPVSKADTDDHEMHSEWYSISETEADKINAARAAGGRIIAVGTTALRALESNAGADGSINAEDAETAIFITPGYKFKTIDGLITNFHLPKSTLFMLVCALAGFETMKAAYKHAVDEHYRFYSYGDTSLLWKADK